MLREDIREKIVEKRPKLSDKSVSTYTSTLVNLPNKIGEEAFELQWYGDNVDIIIKKLDNVAPSKRKSIYSPLYILTGDDTVHDAMIQDAKHTNEKYKEQKKSENEKENWIDWKDVLKKYETRKKKADALFKQKILSNDDINYLNEFIILSCYVLFPPRRLLDYGQMRIRGCDVKKDNCMTAKKLTFNVYKTAKVYGKQEFDMPSELSSIFRKWSKINPSAYLIWNEKGKPTTSSNLNNILNRIFDGQDISVNMLRHSFLTNYYGGKTPSLLEMEETAQKMGHSVKQAMLYIKRT